MTWSTVIHNNSLLNPSWDSKKMDQKDSGEQLSSARTASHSCDAFVEWFAVGSVRRYYPLTMRAGLGESQGRILILSLAKGTLLPVFNLLLWMLCCDEGSVISVLFETWLRILSKNLFHNHYLATCLPHQQWYCFVWMPSLTLGFWLVVALHFW